MRTVVTLAIFLLVTVSVLADQAESDFLFPKLKDGPAAAHIGWLLKEKQAVITEDLYRDYGPMTTRNVSKLFFPNLNAIREKFKKNVAWEQGWLSNNIFFHSKLK